jgi:nitroreductase
MNENAQTHSVARCILRRRSWRVYTEAQIEGAAIRTLDHVAKLAPSVIGSGSARVMFVHEPREVSELTTALTAGLVGKGNLWLRSAPPAAYAVLIGDSARGAREADRFLYNVDTAIAGELVVLAATDLGLGSCWMAAVNAEAAAAYLRLGDDDRIPSVIALGHTGVRRKGSLLAAGWDRVTRVAVSSRRKPLESLCSLDRFDSGRTLPAIDMATLASDQRSLGDVIEALAPTSSFGGVAPDERELRLILESMRLAPSADNGQTWRFVVIRGAERTSQLLHEAGFAPTHGESPGALLVMSAAPFVVKKVRREQPFFLLDHPIALTHALLTAQALGLHWNISFIFDYATVRRWAGVPASHEMTALLALDCQGELAKPPYADHVQLFRMSH